MRLKPSDYAALSDFRYQLRLFLTFSEEAARAADVEPQQHQLLLAVQGLSMSGAPTIKQLADRLVLKHHSTVELVDRLQRRGLVVRERSATDGRVAQVQLTRDGAQLLERLTLAHRDELKRKGPALVKALQAILKKAP